MKANIENLARDMTTRKEEILIAREIIRIQTIIQLRQKKSMSTRNPTKELSFLTELLAKISDKISLIKPQDKSTEEIIRVSVDE